MTIAPPGIRLELSEEGLSDDAITYALDRLAEEDISKPLPWCRKVAQAYEEGERSGKHKWVPCGECENGWVVVEEGGPGTPDTMERCSCHPAFQRLGARGRGRVA